MTRLTPPVDTILSTYRPIASIPTSEGHFAAAATQAPASASAAAPNHRIGAFHVEFRIYSEWI
ncbi:hypothetical protein N7466_006619 [Penicillium verhagenii]|uniref:uncharacterized protein n=1 Tax=Penicillium verhagenii TaxID=1562060 RepID=UPI0025453A56|nr:uncharacterized protein N7466_006619 [Penicillium verhagenii]KAJ5931126.1 hypothetical protein N7466_006619 [Penicillium verhagenii]